MCCEVTTIKRRQRLREETLILPSSPLVKLSPLWVIEVLFIDVCYLISEIKSCQMSH